ncbi:MAG: hypothetical protein LQ351_004765 [Letrouitia transgressa]|nr:MAG: hypothetical protein LQ351_004765 [Letrouitia transgressa]
MKRKRGPFDDVSVEDREVDKRDPMDHFDISVVHGNNLAQRELPEQQDSLEEKPTPFSPPEAQPERAEWLHHQSVGSCNLSLPRDYQPPEPRTALSQERFGSDEVDVSIYGSLRGYIEAQFSLEILLKHRELRLIDQELAKCQISLEQLRRCQAIPFVAMPSSSQGMQDADSGVGSSAGKDSSLVPEWSGTNGPYTRHYRQWLMSDRAFGDSDKDIIPQLQSTANAVPDRSIRASVSAKSNLASQSRTQRGSGSARLKALPSGYAEPKEDKGPMIVRRSTDGLMVKLVCLDCRRSDFNSAQGFINHCRIAHSRNFQSHDAAAIACGEKVELDHTGGIIGESTSSTNDSMGLVHPLIRNASVVASAPPHSIESTLKRKRPSSFLGTTETPLLQKSRHPIPALPSFKPSPETPHLSALFAKSGRGGNLEEEVVKAKTRIEIDPQSESEDGVDSPAIENSVEPSIRPAILSTFGVMRKDRLPTTGAMSPAQPAYTPHTETTISQSRRPKQLTNMDSREVYPSPYNMTGPDQPSRHPTGKTHEALTEDAPASPNLSPNTIEAHQAPSLVSDDGDYEASRSECSSSSSDDDDDEPRQSFLGFGFDEHDDQEAEELGGRSAAAGADHVSLSASPKGSHSTRRSSALASSGTIPDPEPHVSFTNPRRRSRKKGGK